MYSNRFHFGRSHGVYKEGNADVNHGWSLTWCASAADDRLPPDGECRWLQHIARTFKALPEVSAVGISDSMFVVSWKEKLRAELCDTLETCENCDRNRFPAGFKGTRCADFIYMLPGEREKRENLVLPRGAGGNTSGYAASPVRLFFRPCAGVLPVYLVRGSIQ